MPDDWFKLLETLFNAEDHRLPVQSLNDSFGMSALTLLRRRGWIDRIDYQSETNSGSYVLLDEGLAAFIIEKQSRKQETRASMIAIMTLVASLLTLSITILAFVLSYMQG